MVPQVSAILSGMPSLLVVLTMKTLVTPHGVSSHFVWPFEIWLILDLLQDLMYWLPEHRVYHLMSYRPRLPSKIPPGSIIIVAVRLGIPSLLRDNLTLSFALLLILLDSLILINLLHKLAYTGSRLPNQGLPQSVLSRHAYLEGPDSNVVKVAVHLVEHLSVSVQVHFQGLPFLHGHRQ